MNKMNAAQKRCIASMQQMKMKPKSTQQMKPKSTQQMNAAQKRCIASMHQMKSRGGQQGKYKTFGRKVRCLETAKWYMNIKQKNSATERSEKAIARLDLEMMQKCIDASHTPKASGRRIVTKELTFDIEAARERGIQMHKDHPHIARIASKAAKKQRQIQITERGGVPVQKIVWCQREKSVGVQIA